MQLYRPTCLILLTVLIAPVGKAATYTVTSTADSGAGTLRAAIEAANSTIDDDSIIFDAAINAVPINLADSLPEIASAAVGGKLVIQGNTAANTIISGANAYRILRAGESAEVELKALTLTQGNAGFGYGGAVYVSNNANLVIENVTLSNNQARYGGAIYNANPGTLSITDSVLDGNTATDYGGAIYSYNGSLSIASSTIKNSSTKFGGGVLNYDYSTLTISNSTIENNTATVSSGGGIHTTGPTTLSYMIFKNNSTPEYGGGLYANNAAVSVDHALFTLNQAQHGGAIASDGNLTLTSSTLAGNTAEVYAGGVSNYGSLLINNSLLANNTSTNMGANYADCYNGDTLSAHHSLLESSSTCSVGATNITAADPLLDANLVPQTGSPVIDAGNNALLVKSDFDLAGHVRIQNATVDIGAYEYASVPLVTLTAASTTLAEGAATTLTVTRSGSNASALTVNLAITQGAGLETSDYSISGGSISGQTGSVSVTIAAGAASLTLDLAAFDDAVDESDETVTVALASSSAYAVDATNNSATLTISDDDSAAITVTPTTGLITTEAGAAATFTVVLNSQPTADVTITLSSNDASEGSAMPSSLVFTNANWNVAQTVTVTGVDDAIVDGNVGYTIILNPATSSDAYYHGRDAADVGVVNTDNDSAAGIPTLSEWALGLLAMLLTVMGVQSVGQRRSEH